MNFPYGCDSTDNIASEWGEFTIRNLNPPEPIKLFQSFSWDDSDVILNCQQR